MMISEATWVAVVITLINMVGSVLLTLIRLYYRAHYNVGEFGRGNGYDTKLPQQMESKE
jgi:hypothetical protein